MSWNLRGLAIKLANKVENLRTNKQNIDIIQANHAPISTRKKDQNLVCYEVQA